MLTYEQDNNILYEEDPTIKYSSSTCYYLNYMPSREFNGIQLSSVDTDLLEKYFQVSVEPPTQGERHTFELVVKFNITSSPKMDDNSEGYSMINYFNLDLEVDSPVSIKVSGASASGPGSDIERKVLEAIQRGLWAVSMGLSIISFAGGNYIVSTASLPTTALSYPSLYVYGKLFDIDWSYGNDAKTLYVSATWDPGWEAYYSAPIEIVLDIRTRGAPYPPNTYFTLHYDYSAYIGFDDRVGPSYYTRAGTYSSYGGLDFPVIPP